MLSAPAVNVPLIVGAADGSVAFLALVAVVIWLVRRSRRSNSESAMPARPSDTPMTTARHEYGPLPPITKSLYGEGGIPRRSNYSLIHAAQSESPYAQTAADFSAGLPEVSNYSKMPADAKPESPYAQTAGDFLAGLPEVSNYSEFPKHT